MIRHTIHHILKSRRHNVDRRSLTAGGIAGAFALSGMLATGAIANETREEGTYESSAQQSTIERSTHAQEQAERAQKRAATSERSTGQTQAQGMMQASATSLHATSEQVRMVQEELRDAGFDPGQIDGQWSASTQAAARSFQEAKNLPATGKLDTALLSALDAEKVLEGDTGGGFFDALFGRIDTGQEGSAEASGGAATPIYVSPQHVAEVQRTLRERGYDPGTIDGQWGESTREAANRFRQAQSLPRSKPLDIALLQALDLSAALSAEPLTATASRTNARTDASATQTQMERDASGASPASAEPDARQARTDADDTERMDAARAQNREMQTADTEMAALSSAAPTQLHAGHATIQAVQRQLQNEGHDPGSVDGQWGESTQAAIREYQQANEMQGDGKLTLPTLASLNVDITSGDYVKEQARSSENPTGGADAPAK
jgi:peptidoglycan hydrolase-like protein with peptidoglycan-binding domain